MSQLLVEGMVRSAASTLEESLHFYWPTHGPNELAERNLSLHIAGALQRNGFLVFGEGNSENDSSTRFDVIALKPTSEAAVIVECKRLLNEASAAAMAADAGRISRFQFHSGTDLTHPELRVSRSFGVLLATTWSEKYAEWFLADEDQGDPGDGFIQLWRAVPKGALWGASVLQHFRRRSGPKAGEYAKQWLVYTVFQRP